MTKKFRVVWQEMSDGMWFQRRSDPRPRAQAVKFYSWLLSQDDIAIRNAALEEETPQ